MTEGYSILQPRVGDQHAQRRPVAVRAAVRRRRGHRSVHPRRLRRLPGPVRRRARSSARASTTSTRCSGRSAGGFPENRILSHDLLEGAYARVRAGQRRDAVRGLPVGVPRRRQPAVRAGSAATGRSPRGSCLACPACEPRSACGREPDLGLSRAGRSWTTCGGAWCPWRCSLLLLLRLVRAGRRAVLHARGGRRAPAAVAADALRPSWPAGPADLPAGQHGRHGLAGVRAPGAARGVLRSPTLPYDAYISLEAIARTASRVLVTRRKLLEWRTASDAQRAARTATCPASTPRCGSCRRWRPPLAVLTLAIASARDVLPVAAPVVAHVARVAGDRVVAEPPAAPGAGLGCPARTTRSCARSPAAPGGSSRRSSGRRTTTCRPTTSRRTRRNGAAHRTSPTNIGLALLANLAAYDFGYVTAGEVIGPDRRGRLATVDRLQRYRGHFTTGTTRERSSRCARCTSPPSTAATWPATCSRWPRA